MAGFKIPAVVKAAATKAFAQSPLGQVVRQAANARRLLGVAASGPSPAVLQALNSAAGGQDIQGLIRALSASDPTTAWGHIERYAMSGSHEYSLLQELLGTLGPVGRVLGALLPKKASAGGYGALGENLSQAIDMLAAFSDQPEVLDSLERILTQAGATVSWPHGRPVRTTVPPDIATSGGGVRPPSAPGGSGSSAGGGSSGGGRSTGRTTGRKPGRKAGPAGGAGGAASTGAGGSSGVGRTPSGGGTRTPESETSEAGAGEAKADGRVEGIAPGSTTLAVSDGGTIHALPPNHPALTGAWVETPESSNVHSFAYDIDAHRLYVRFKDRPQKGEKVRPNAPGSIYAYYNVPLDLFMSMFQAGSKGTWVWDHLRIRGTLSGHRYDYSLVGVAGGYVPRKATLTPEGESYIGRTVFSDKGRQLRSSRPDQLVRPLGRMPKTGRSGLGG